ncbi:methylamine utilization protein [Lysinibacillus irui]|uniref:Methylamine utilization protein n=1 Tax=Lysinibacillus irui TaxID=2998077 RepID=A0ABU5NLA0_9BACI|nr:methylamine utilization protein [Lysinibacillus irui]MEA0555085.1 methylamine utilization protein [Lysinibacillus irui]MEA0976800.1 methylamine utilization protein [Lysinibacillus irui]MEA1042954.1 methylamine utilization protein [Lysinibacillus irui]
MKSIPSHKTGLNIGDELPELYFFHSDGKKVDLIKDECYILIFVSNYCLYCIDLLPEVEKIKNVSKKHKLILFSTGDNEDNIEMKKYFNWKFPIVHLTEDEMEKYFKVVKQPFCIITNKNEVKQKGVIYNQKDFIAMLSLT